MRNFRRIRRGVAAGLLVWFLPGCYSWKPGYLAPSEMTNKTVRVTTTAGSRMRLYKSWVSGDSLLGHRPDGQGFLAKDTIRVALADVTAVEIGKYKGVIDPARTIPLALAGRQATMARVLTATDTLLLARPWVDGESLLGVRDAGKSGGGDTVAVALAGIRRLELRRYDGGRTGGLIAAGLLAATVAAAAIGCAGGGCAQSFGGW